jgi:hypothetical protein
VACRLRPLNNSERNRAARALPDATPEEVALSRCVKVVEGTGNIIMYPSDVLPGHRLYKDSGFVKGPETWPFDAAFDVDSSQQQVFDRIGKPALDSLLSGFNASVLAYGQTGGWCADRCVRWIEIPACLWSAQRAGLQPWSTSF